MAFHNEGDRPDRPLVVKCAFDRSLRRITFQSAKNCTFTLLRARVEQCFALSASSFNMSYQDDDGETTDIHSDFDLTEAIQYFHAGPDDGGGSSYGSVLSGYSGRVSRKITLRLQITVEYDGPSLSDTGSLVSLEDYAHKRNHGSISLSDKDSFDGMSQFNEPDEDSVTISSHDTTGRLNKRTQDITGDFSETSSITEEDVPQHQFSPNRSTIPTINEAHTLTSQPSESPDLLRPSRLASRKHSNSTMTAEIQVEPDQVFERLRLMDSQPFPGSQSSLPLDSSMRGAQWLRDQNDRVVRHMISATPLQAALLAPSAPSSAISSRESVSYVQSESEDASASSSFQAGDLELQQDGRGRYYYAFTSDSSSHTGSERGRSPKPPSPVMQDILHNQVASQDVGEDLPIASGSGLAKRVSQVSHITESGESSSSSASGPRSRRRIDRGRVESGQISPELLQAILESESQGGPHLVTDCSSCGDILDSFRYVCSTCGEKEPRSRDDIALARSLANHDTTDPFADPTNDFGLRLYADVVPNSELSLLSVDDSVEVGSDGSSAGASAWSLIRDHSHRPSEPLTRYQSSPDAGTSSWSTIFGTWRQTDDDGQRANNFPLSTFKMKVKHGVQRSVLGASNSKGKNISSLPDDTSSSGSHVSHQQTTLPAWLQKKPPSPLPQYFHPSPLERPSISVSERTSERSDSSSGSRSNSNSADTPTAVAFETGYELCPKCIATAGVFHAESALSASTPTPTSGFFPPSSPLHINGGASLAAHQIHRNDVERISPTTVMGSASSPEWNLSSNAQVVNPSAAPKKPKRKIQIRHAYIEKFWGIGGWQDVELDDTSSCSICNKNLDRERFKCTSCEQFNLCRAHYSQVHEIHPSHAFVAVPDKIPEQIVQTTEPTDEVHSMTHPGVRCNHCLQEIVGARFHCALCDDVDICANCESAGLPGNLTSPEGGHDSSHIMIKIPLPLETNEVRLASRRARALWNGRDAPVLGTGTSRVRSDSFDSSYQKTVIGAPTADRRRAPGNMDHRIPCRGCNKSIIGVRYQCASCASLPSSYNLCVDCERISFTLHDPMHIFFKISKPTDRPIESHLPLMSPAYEIPAGQDADGNHYGEDFKLYLQTVMHGSAICDRCIEPIHGEWFRCANCDADNCEDCEQLGVHDSRHVFMVFKSKIDMKSFRRTADLDNPNRKIGILKHLVHAA